MAIRILIQLGLRPEELFALRLDDLARDSLRIDEAVVEGPGAPVKSEASAASLYVPPDLAGELADWARSLTPEPGAKVDQRTMLFTSPKGKIGGQQNYLNRALKPAAIRARVGVQTRKNKAGKEVETTDVNFRVLRRTCATLFGAKAKDPRDTQAQLRHADPTVTLRHYQQSIPASVQAAALALERDLVGEQKPNILNRN